MRILYHFRTQGTGAEGVHIAGIANAFEQLGHEVVFANPTNVDPRTSAGANPFDRKQPRGLLSRLAAHAPALVFELLEIAYNFAAYAKLRKKLCEATCDLIYERHAFFLAATALLAQQRRIPLVVEVNELAGDERIRDTPWLAPLARLADQFTFRRASRIVVVSPHLRRRIVQMGVPEGKILVLPNAVSDRTLQETTDGSRIRQLFRCEDSNVIGFVGWFVPWHRLDVLVNEIANITTNEPRLRLLLIGDGPLREALVSQAEALGITDRVIFTGSVPHTEIGDYIAAMDVCVVPHSNEYRSPIKLFEYMAHGRAIVAPRTEPIASVVRHQENGLLFDPELRGDLGKQLAASLADADLRKNMGQQARLDVMNRHTWIQNAKSVLNGIGSTLNRRLISKQS